MRRSSVEHDDDCAGLVDPHRDAPRKASRSVAAARCNRLAIALDFAFEELSELRHELGVADRLEVQRRIVEPES